MSLNMSPVFNACRFDNRQDIQPLNFNVHLKEAWFAHSNTQKINEQKELIFLPFS